MHQNNRQHFHRWWMEWILIWHFDEIIEFCHSLWNVNVWGRRLPLKKLKFITIDAHRGTKSDLYLRCCCRSCLSLSLRELCTEVVESENILKRFSLSLSLAGICSTPNDRLYWDFKSDFLTTETMFHPRLDATEIPIHNFWDSIIFARSERTKNIFIFIVRFCRAHKLRSQKVNVVPVAKHHQQHQQ